jgi:cell division protein FtsW
VNDRPRRGFSRPELKTAGAPLGRRHKPDYWLLVLTAVLLTIGVVVVYSISPGLAASQHISQNYFITKQLVDVVLGVATFALAAYLPTKVWLKIAQPLIILALAGCLIVMLMPVDAIYQAHRWIRVGGFSFQIAELIKFALLIWTSNFLARRWREGKLADLNATFKVLLGLLLAVGVLVAKLQSDLGSAAVMIAMIVLMAFVAGVPLKRLAILAGIVVVLVSLAIFTTGYRRDRLTSFLHPQQNCLTTSYQACQALISVGSGGALGLGLGYSVQAYGYTPEASDDSIFAIMAEQFGFVGTVIIVIIYAAFISRLKRVIEHTSDQFTRLLVVGVMAWLSTQMVINIGAMIGLLPLKGITLPLISQGGTSLIFLTAALGMVFQLSRYTSYNVTEPKNPQNENTNNSLDRRRVGRPHNPGLVARPRA